MCVPTSPVYTSFWGLGSCKFVDLQEKDVGQSFPCSTLRNVRELIMGFKTLSSPVLEGSHPQFWRELTQMTSLTVFCSSNAEHGLKYYVPSNYKDLPQSLTQVFPGEL